MARILIIEDEPDLQQILAYNLGQAGHEVLLSRYGEEGLLICQREPLDLLLLDLMLPDIPGTAVCKALRADPRTAALPIVMLTARSEEIDRVLGFELGADDYVTKPFSVRELLLRVQAILRRKAPEPGPVGPTLEFGCLRVDRAAHRVWVEGREVRLTAMELRLLLMLHESKNRVLSRSVLLDHVWNIEADITTRTVDTHIKRLREKLGPAGAYIETVRGVGYRFVAAPEEAAR